MPSTPGHLRSIVRAKHKCVFGLLLPRDPQGRIFWANTPEAADPECRRGAGSWAFALPLSTGAGGPM